MSKKNKNKEKNQEKEIVISDITSLEKALNISLSALIPSFKLKNLNQIMILAFFKESLLNKIVSVNDIVSFEIYGKLEQFQIESINSGTKQGKFLITEQTFIAIIEYEKQPPLKNKEPETIVLEGVDEKLIEIIETIKISLESRQIFFQSGLSPVKGILIYGPSGVGKTSLIKRISQELRDIHFLILDCSAFLSKFVGEGEKSLSEVFAQAKSFSNPCILVLEDIHQICDRKDLGKETSRSLMISLMKELDGIVQGEKVLVIATTNQIASIDPGLRRAGRFDKEIRFEIPQTKERGKILRKYLEKLPHELTSQQVDELNENMNGFTGADIQTFLRESLLKTLQTKDPSPTISKKTLDSCLSDIQPSGLKDLLVQIPKTLWSDIGGYDSLKLQIKQVVEWPLKHPEAFKRMGIKPSKGVLLYGPPGCSKTMIAKAIATESSLNFIAIKGPELFSKYVGDSEKAIRELYKRARLCAPAVVFFDEIDAIASKRSASTDVSDRVLLQLLTEMDGIEINNVITIAATNRPDVLDLGITRPGRMDHLIYVPPPDYDARVEILKLNVLGNKMPVNDVSLEELAKKTENYSGAEICLICREAGLKALSRDINEKEILIADFLYALSKVKPRITTETLKYYQSFEENRKLL